MKKIILTIDTEGPTGKDPVLYQIWGKVGDNEYYGIPKIIEVCDRYNIKGLFFVDIPEIWDLGYEKIREVILYIKKKGHDVGMHIHPHHMPGESRHFLFEYTKEEQRDIIKKCTEKFCEICGESPKSFRAGKYGANYDTLDIIEEMGYHYDFSEFYSNKWCGIDPPISYILPQGYKSLVEFPVTIFRSCNFIGYSRYDKMEVTNDFSEMKHILQLYSKTTQNEMIVLFMHSFSLVNFRFTPDKPTLNKTNLDRFESVLNYIVSSKLFKFISEKDLGDLEITSKNDSSQNIVTTKGIHRQLYYTLKRAYAIRKYNRKANILIVSLELLVIIIFFIFLSFIL